MRLANKVTIITGASSGIGRSSAYLFAKEGAKVVVVANINVSGGQETVANIEANRGEAIFVQTDVAVASEVENLVRVTKERFGRIDILFNNAGVFVPASAIENTDESAFDKAYGVIVKGAFLTTKYAVPEMRKRRGGVIINTASMAGIRPGGSSAIYDSAKGALIVLTKALALELAPYGIRVNCINPWLTNTPMVKAFPEEVRENIIRETIPLGRAAEPEDVAYAALYLASDESSMLTGTSINVDGGYGI